MPSAGREANRGTSIDPEPIMSAKTQAIAAVAATLCVISAGASAADDRQAAASPCPGLSSIQQRIVAKSDEGIGALRQFVWRTKFIYGIDMFDVRERLDGWRAACGKPVGDTLTASKK
jgi:hypothetical protein